MKQKTIAIMAAGMGSRFGGLKQIHAVVNEYAILDFSIYDAIQAGFNHIVFIVRDDISRKV
jgi:CTP:molybdopterin cytidylyltransferase MocA